MIIFLSKKIQGFLLFLFFVIILLDSFDLLNYYKGCLVNIFFLNFLKDRKIKCLLVKECLICIGDFFLFYVIQFVIIYFFGNDLFLFGMCCKILLEDFVFYEGV